MKRKKRPFWNNYVYKIPLWIGTPFSIFVHSLLFIASFILIMFGFNADRVMLILTTIVSLEAIYLTLFVQMSVNRSHKRLKDIEDDIDDILEDTESLTEDQKQELKTKIKNHKQ